MALDQVARLYAETAASERFAICKNYREIQAARETGKIAFLITMEGIEPLGTDLNQLRVFYELGVRGSDSRTHEPMRRVMVEFSRRAARRLRV